MNVVVRAAAGAGGGQRVPGQDGPGRGDHPGQPQPQPARLQPHRLQRHHPRQPQPRRRHRDGPRHRLRSHCELTTLLHLFHLNIYFKLSLKCNCLEMKF